MKQKSSISHDEAVIQQLREDPALVIEYLKAAMEETAEPHVLLLALRRVTEARGGFANEPARLSYSSRGQSEGSMDHERRPR